ncbi:helix-turn-helix transcriptional regulator [Embleya scabrispora]|uniref:helix-turn-helix transcriptional regulator n=1 Tax=Embleya scabrispora TaxID=159449 RepID=UPI00039A341F|nr:histidine kinase [Embleya scabrispora]MYS78724.1 sensor histidine kinase [Streptomyces sp. SID5474]
MGFVPKSMATLGKAITGRDLPATDSAGAFGSSRARRVFRGRNRADVLVVLVAMAVDLLGYAVTVRGPGPGETAGNIAFLVASALCLIARRRAPVRVLLLVLVLQVGLNLSSDIGQRFGFTLAIALYTVGLSCRPRTIAAAAVLTMAAQTSGYRDADVPLFYSISGDLVATALVVGASAAVRHWQDQVEVNRELLAERALTEERRRIARELHDIVAHHITTMHLMSGGARASLERDLDGARGALLTLEASGRLALDEMRQLLGVLRSDKDPETAPSAPQPGVDDLDRLIAESCLAGLPTELQVAGTRRELSLPVGLALYRITQEALTNARKHAGSAAMALVRLEYLPDAVAIEIRDDGGGDRVGSGYAMTGGGHGLLGMRERVAVHGGAFEAGHVAGGGFRVAASIPVTSRPVSTVESAVEPIAGADAGSAGEPVGRSVAESVGKPVVGAVPAALTRLSPVEIEVLRLVAAGKATGEIAHAMRVDGAAVERYESELLGKLALRDRAQAVVMAYETGLVRVGHTTAAR